MLVVVDIPAVEDIPAVVDIPAVDSLVVVDSLAEDTLEVEHMQEQVVL